MCRTNSAKYDSVSFRDSEWWMKLISECFCYVLYCFIAVLVMTFSGHCQSISTAFLQMQVFLKPSHDGNRRKDGFLKHVLLQVISEPLWWMAGRSCGHGLRRSGMGGRCGYATLHSGSLREDWQGGSSDSNSLAKENGRDWIWWNHVNRQVKL